MPVLGCIADDVTGATDLANMLVRGGMRTIQTIGVPAADFDPDGVDAVVVALKSRTAPVGEAVRDSLAALDWLRAAGCRQILFKYCSTFDSTDEGNIGPVADALLAALGGDLAIVCPAFPETGRTVYQGHLFVGGALLNESGMEHHPLNPMTDANLVRVLGRQTDGQVGLLPYTVVRKGAEAIRAELDRLRAEGYRYAVADTLADDHLAALGEAVADHALVTGGSGIAIGLPDNFRRQGLLTPRSDAARLPETRGGEAVIAGSCSRATRAQVAYMRARRPAFEVDPLKLEADADAVVDAAIRWAAPLLEDGPVLVYATAEPDAVRRVQERLGVAEAGHLVESALGRIARGLVDQGVRRLIVAGGETAGAVVGALEVPALRIGPQIEPGVPWTASVRTPPVALALKSGNFGGEAFFLTAFEALA